MIYFLYGPNTFRIRERVASLRQGLMDAGALNQVRIDAAKHGFDDFLTATSSQSLLANQSLTVVYDLIKNGDDDFKDRIIKWLKNRGNSGEEVVVFVEREEPDKRTTIFRALSKFIVEKYPHLTGAEAGEWVDGRTKVLGAKLDLSARQKLVSEFGDDLWRLDNEINKLAAFAGDRTIEAKDIDLLVPHKLNDRIFQTIDALANQNLAVANQLINNQLAWGMNEQQLLAMIAYQFRNIALIKSLIAGKVRDADLPAKSKLHPFVGKKSSGFARRLSPTRLSKIFKLLHRVDLAIKSGKTPPDVGLDILTAQISRV